MVCKRGFIKLLMLVAVLIAVTNSEGREAVNDPRNRMKTRVANDPLDVSLIQLISNPEKFHGKRVRFVGFACLKFEGDAIYLHEEDYKHGLTKNGLWLDITTVPSQQDFRGYVVVEGAFSAKDHGHMDLFSGAIKNIRRFDAYPPIDAYPPVPPVKTR